jgi:hypothetical protein
LQSCDPYYILTIENDLIREVNFATEPLIDSIYNHNIPSKIRSENDSNVYYRIPADSSYIIYSSVGYKPTSAGFPLNEIEIIYEQDTFLIQNKKALIGLFTKYSYTRDFKLTLDTAFINTLRKPDIKN